MAWGGENDKKGLRDFFEVFFCIFIREGKLRRNRD